MDNNLKLHCEQIGDDLVEGDNFVVVCENSSDESFWLLLCDKLIHNVKESYTND